jgi:hypothetical protein
MLREPLALPPHDPPVAIGRTGAMSSASTAPHDDRFVGRQDELLRMRGALDAAARGAGCLVLVCGDPGIGKTRLAVEASSDARGRGFHVVWGRCWEAGGAPPYWPWIEVLRQLLDGTERPSTEMLGRHAAQLARIVPEAFPDTEPAAAPTDPESGRFLLFDAVATLLRRSAAQRPLLVVVDDVHAADRVSVLLLAFLARTLRDARVLVVATCREAEARATPELGEALVELARDAVRLTLGGLDPGDVETMLERDGVRPSDTIVAKLHRLTDGNRFFVREIARLYPRTRPPTLQSARFTSPTRSATPCNGVCTRCPTRRARSSPLPRWLDASSTPSSSHAPPPSTSSPCSSGSSPRAPTASSPPSPASPDGSRSGTPSSRRPSTTICHPRSGFGCTATSATRSSRSCSRLPIVTSHRSPPRARGRCRRRRRPLRGTRHPRRARCHAAHGVRGSRPALPARARCAGSRTTERAPPLRAAARARRGEGVVERRAWVSCGHRAGGRRRTRARGAGPLGSRSTLDWRRRSAEDDGHVALRDGSEPSPRSSRTDRAGSPGSTGTIAQPHRAASPPKWRDGRRSTHERRRRH